MACRKTEMSITEAQQRIVASHRVARLATAGEDGVPHVIPICYAFDGADFFSPIDEKPKRVGPSGLKRVRNLRENPRAALVIDRYSDDWGQLGYLLFRGTVEIITGGPVHLEAVRLLRERYNQYRAMALESALLLKLRPDSVVEWGNLD